MTVLAALLLDILAVTTFSAVGRDTHERGLSLAGVAETAWPFITGVLLGWILMRAWRRPWAHWPIGVGIWLTAVVVGLALRWATGDGIAFSFQLVTLVTLGVLLLLPRTAARFVAKSRARRPSDSL